MLSFFVKNRRRKVLMWILITEYRLFLWIYCGYQVKVWIFSLLLFVGTTDSSVLCAVKSANEKWYKNVDHWNTFFSSYFDIVWLSIDSSKDRWYNIALLKRNATNSINVLTELTRFSLNSFRLSITYLGRKALLNLSHNFCCHNFALLLSINSAPCSFQTLSMRLKSFRFCY